MATKRRKEKRAIAHDIMQELHNLQPPGRFLTEARRDDETHSFTSSKRWVEVSNDKAIEKIMHSLREKAKGTGGTRNDNNIINGDDGKPNLKRDEEETKEEGAIKSNGLVDNYKGTNANVEQLVGEDELLQQQILPLPMGDTEENLVGQFDDVFDDTDVAGENHEQLPNEAGQFDGLCDTAEENVVEQSDDVFDSAYDGGNNTTIVATTAIIPHKNVSVDDIDFCICRCVVCLIYNIENYSDYSCLFVIYNIICNIIYPLHYSFIINICRMYCSVEVLVSTTTRGINATDYQLRHTNQVSWQQNGVKKSVLLHMILCKSCTTYSHLVDS